MLFVMPLICLCTFFFFKQYTAYEWRFSDWSSDVCSSDLSLRIASMVAQIAAIEVTITRTEAEALLLENQLIKALRPRYNVLLRDDKSYPQIFISSGPWPRIGMHRGPRTEAGRYFGPYPSSLAVRETLPRMQRRSEEHTSELQSLMRISYAVFCLKKQQP